MPQRIVDLLEGESLLNDATGLLALQFGVEMVVQGTTPPMGRGLLEFAWLTLGGTIPWFATPYVLDGIRGQSRMSLLTYRLVFSFVLVLLRMARMYPAANVAWWTRNRILKQVYERPKPNQIFVVGRTGMRGVVASANALPQTLNNGSPFPERRFIIYLTFCPI